MELLYFAVPIGMAVGALFIAAFVWATRSGQFDDLDGPAHRAIHPEMPADTSLTRRTATTPPPKSREP